MASCWLTAFAGGFFGSLLLGSPALPSGAGGPFRCGSTAYAAGFVCWFRGPFGCSPALPGGAGRLALLFAGRDGVSWLVHAQGAAAGQLEAGDQAEALVADRRALEAQLLELGHHGLHVVHHQVELVRLGVAGQDRVHAHFRGRQREDQPAVAGVNEGPVQHVAKEGADLLGVVGVNQRVYAGDHGGHDRFVTPAGQCTAVPRCGLVSRRATLQAVAEDEAGLLAGFLQQFHLRLGAVDAEGDLLAGGHECDVLDAFD